jgi:integrase
MKANSPIRAIPVCAWPEADRVAWQAACRPGERLRRGGAAAHLKPVTREDLARRYGLFLDFLQRTRRPTHAHEPTGAVTPEHVGAWVAELRERVGSVTVYGSVHKLRRAAELLSPGHDFGWLREIESDLDLVKQPRSKYEQLVTSAALLEAGLVLFQEAELAPPGVVGDARRRRRAERRRAQGAADRAALNRAVLARNGLMVALLALCPIRLRSFAGLTLGRSLVRVGAGWWIALEADETKSGRADERPVAGLLTRLIERYVEHHRSVLGRGRLEREAGPLWISSESGLGMPQPGVEAVIRRTTAAALGIEIGAHMFRTAAATTAAVRAPGLPHLGSALLQHVDPRITEEHYNRARAHQAVQAYADVLKRIEEE